MKYISTRGKAPILDFEEVVLAGLANDGGLYVPERLPKFSQEQIAQWSALSYHDIVFNIIKPFIGDCIEDADLKSLIAKAYGNFSHKAIAPLAQLGRNEWLLELFHGPTLAFKDFALQLLGHIFSYLLQRRNQSVVILGATSGDTGSAAIEGCRHCDNVDIFILHPYERVSDVQRRQMTTVAADQVNNIAIRGDFDDCQALVKQCFSQQDFLPDGRRLVAVNSINWARIMAQIVYYFYAALSIGGPHRKVSFSVPTGNFGDIYAGYLAKQMGLPVEQLIIATNSNDILHRCIDQNDFSKRSLIKTLSPSMDIVISSNFERLLFDLFDRDGKAVELFMQDFNNGKARIDEACWRRAQKLFDSCSVKDEEACETICQVYSETGEILDPHTAIGLKAARECNSNDKIPMITLATAHPVKFSEAILKSGLSMPNLPLHMNDLFEKKERYTVLDNSLSLLQQTIQERLS